MLKTLKALEEVKVFTSQAAFPKLPEGQELSPGGSLSGVDLGLKEVMFPPLHLGLSSCQLCRLLPTPQYNP